MRRIFLAAAAAMSAFALAVPAQAHHACDSTVIDGAGTAYVVIDNPQNPHGGVWLYEESNGETGLQRADDSCYGENGDTVIF